MIVLSAGMQKAGTGWYFNLTNDLLVAAGYHDVRAVRDEFGLHAILMQYNCNLEEPTLAHVARLAVPHLRGRTFVVKTHHKPTRALRAALGLGLMKATYIYRDPRDVVVSAYDHGEKIRRQGERHTFGQLDSVEAAIRYTRRLLKTWDEWEHARPVLSTRYEDLTANPIQELRRLAEFLRLRVSEDTFRAVMARYEKGGPATEDGKGLHFNQGVAGRFREILSPQQLALCQEQFGEYLQRMGYSE